MRLTVDSERIRVEYTAEEWRRLEEFYRRAGLELYTTRNLFGRGVEAKVYRYPPTMDSEYLLRMLPEHLREYRNGDYTLLMTDSINDEVLYVDTDKRSVFNVALFRVVPTCDSAKCATEVELRGASAFLPLQLLKSIGQFMKDFTYYVLKAVYNSRFRYKLSIEVLPREGGS